MTFFHLLLIITALLVINHPFTILRHVTALRAKDPISLVIDVDTQFNLFANQLALSYLVISPDVNISVNLVSDAQAQADVQANVADLSFKVCISVPCIQCR